MKNLKKDIGTILLVDKLAKAGRDKKIFSVLAKYLSKPKNSQVVINLTRLSRTTKEGQTVVIPGKLLSMGNISHKLTVYAYKASDSAKAKLEAAGCSLHNFDDLLAKQPSKTVLIG